MIKKLKYLALVLFFLVIPRMPTMGEAASSRADDSIETAPPPVGSLYGAFPYGGKSLGPPPPATWPVLGASYSDYLPSSPVNLTTGSDSASLPVSISNHLADPPPGGEPRWVDPSKIGLSSPTIIHAPAPPWMPPGQIPGYGSMPYPPGVGLPPDMASGWHAPFPPMGAGFPGMASGGKMPFPMTPMPGNFPFSMHGPPPQGYPPGMMPGSPMASFPGMPFHSHNASFPGMALDPNDPCWGPCKQAAYDTYMASASGIPLPAAPPSEGSGAKVTTATFIALVQSQVKMIIVDTRTGPLDDGKRIPGAISLSPEVTLEQINSSLPERNILVVTYSNHAGEKSASRLANRLREMGYLNVIEYRDGFLGWLNSGQKVETKK